MGYQIKCSFNEKVVVTDICRFFGCFTPRLGRPYYLEPAKESLTCADLISEDLNVVPVYMQVKVSHGLKTIRKFASSKRKNRSVLEDIPEYRDGAHLDEMEELFLYFQLRKKAKNATDFQHNVLMSYANTGFSHAFYVAPLLIDKAQYESQFLNYSNFPEYPFYVHHYRQYESNWISLYGFIPFLRNHISIIPHERVETHEHFYAYSTHGLDVTWHSPTLIQDQPSRLSDRMIEIMNEFYFAEKKETIKTLSEKLRKMPIMSLDVPSVAERELDDAVRVISRHGYLLEKYYDIKQVVFALPK